MIRRVLVGLCGVLALVNGWGAQITLSDMAVGYTLNLPYSPVIRAVTQIGWALIFIAMSWRLIRSGNARRLVAPLLTTYGVWGVLWLAVFGRSDYDRGRVPFQIVLTLVLLLPFWWSHLRD